MTANTASDMLDMLRRHYLPEGRPPGGIFAPEIQSPDGGRRADLIWQGVTAGSGYRLIGHEIKVTRADVMVELADPTKSDPWQRFCHEWWLVVLHPSLVEGLELPPTWGVMAPPSGRRTRSMTIVQKAPLLKPSPQAPALRTLATWLHWRHHNSEAALSRAQGDILHLRKRAENAERQVPHEGMARSREREIVEQIVRDLGGVQGASIGDWRTVINPDDVVAALKDLGDVQARAQRAAEELKWRRDELRRMARTIEQALKRDEVTL